MSASLPSLVPLLREFSGGATRSAAALARAAGRSPLEVRRGVASLRELGVDLHAVRGKGYRAATPFEMLDRGAICAALARESRRGATAIDVAVLDEVDSTNACLLREAAAGAPSPRAALAEIQTAGRGRRGRTWYSVPGASLAFSMLWRFPQRLDFLKGLSLAAGVAVVRVLHRIGAREARLKWPNDIVHRHHKLAGILVETQGSQGGPSIAVIGVGINLRLPRAVRDRIDQAVADVASLAPAIPGIPGRNHLAAMFLGELARVLEQFAAGGFNALREEWAALHAYQGQAVRVHCAGNENVMGRVTGVAGDGALLVATEAGERRFYSGEISLRAA
jgi:BirA family biotin operon repressor/biotin-[acetyl-CoA-carboxylase] ligase